jgi:EmrB/QacA subfamily drug resistance transporter
MTASQTAPERVALDDAAKRHILLMFAGLMVAMLLASLDQMIFTTALPTIVGELDGVNHMLWVTTAYFLASTITLPVYGKLGDLVGRKGLFIAAIGLFLVGSVFGALANSMPQLILGRSIQGLGGGGLMILAQAIIADVVPARERGRYMGVMGGVFALSSIGGPLLGGWFTDGIGWRWAFWMNLPLGALAIVAAVAFLHPPRAARRTVKVDTLGIGFLTVASACLVLMTTWGGTTYPWSSTLIRLLIAGAVIAGVSFVLVERRAAEPVMPLHLFRDRNFNLTTGAGLIIGIAMFGAIAYLPTYLQMVTGKSATQAGLLLIPMMAGLLFASISSGQFVSRTGKYKALPVAGLATVSVALALLSTMSPSVAVWVICSYLVLMGLGLGMAMQILILVVQNSFPVSQVGTATATNNYFRQIGASMGSAIVGSLFTSRLVALLAERLPSGGAAGNTNAFTPSGVRDLPAAVREVIVGAYSDALTPIFLWMVPIVLVGLVLLVFVQEKPLATTIERDILPESLEIDGSNSAVLEPVGADLASEAVPARLRRGRAG